MIMKHAKQSESMTDSNITTEYDAKVYHCQQCNQPIRTIHRCPKPCCTTVYCSHMCRNIDKLKNGHDKWVCGKVDPFEIQCKIVQIDGRNNGVVSNESLVQGELVLVETPSIEQDSDFSKIPHSILARLYELEPRPSKDLQSKFQFNEQVDRIFINFANFNHSCKPNADFLFLKDYNIMVVVATTTIPPNTEITINYFGGIQKDMQTKLYDRWRFRCTCIGCTNKRFNTIINVIATLKEQLAESDDVIESMRICDKLLSFYPLIEASPMAYYEVYTVKSELALTHYDSSMYALIAYKHFNKCLPCPMYVDMFI